MNNYKLTVGLEVHAELKTNSKMFCGCENSPELEAPNIHICPICMGHPGTLPVINKEAVKKVLLVGTAVEGTIADFTEFDRKNYFYPDIPKGYQISQYKHPLVQGGSLNEVKLTRIHLEEDTARSTHEGTTNSLVDFNRAGVPLMELVTLPVIHTSTEAVNFAKELQLLLQYLGVSSANMEKGEMRIEANISVQKSDLKENSQGPTLGTKVEVKNLNSFKALEKAIEFEYKRQVALIEKGGGVVQETRGWDEDKQITFSQRLKESAHDYRYFPDPDLPKLMISKISDFSLENLKKSRVELPSEKRKRFLKDFDLKSEDIEIYITDRQAGSFFEEVTELILPLGKKYIKLASNYITSDLAGLSKTTLGKFTTGGVTKEKFVKIITMIQNGKLSSRGAKDILKIIFENEGEPEVIAVEKNLIQKSDPTELRKIMQEIIEGNPESVNEYKKGKESLLQFFVGQGMKAMKGAGNPELLKQVILDLLK